MSSARYIVGDSLTVLRSLPDASVDLVFTSPPFLALRSYLPADHPDKALEIGSEPTPGEFIDTLLDIVEECRRVLAPHGSLCVELGDTYSGSGGAGGDYNVGGLRDGQNAFDGAAKRRRKENGHAVRDDAPRPPRNGRRNRPLDEAAGILTPRSRPGPEGRDRVTGWPLDKSLCLIPESFRWALVYGRNPFTGRETPRWRARNVVRWHRPNPPVGALGDKFRPATSDVVMACMSKTRYFDLDAVRQPHVPTDGKGNSGVGSMDGNTRMGRRFDERVENAAGAPPLDTWIISTEPYAGSHYATFPRDLVVKPVLAMCPQRVCTTCGEPSRRIVDVSYTEGQGGTTGVRRNLKEPEGRTNGTGMTGKKVMDRSVETTGWTDCGHDTWRNGITLDPFAGSGTTLAVATGHGRDAIGIDLDERNADLALSRVGMFLSVESYRAEETVA